tara:strand:- start:245 stop:475 length:231 start_codon:yes stop_codon:yes gene_type:complete
MSDLTKIYAADEAAEANKRNLRKVKDNTIRDAVVYEDMESKESRSIPNKLIRALGKQIAFELIDTKLDLVTPTKLT